MLLDRRNLLRGLFAAPAIIAIERLMPVKLFVPPDPTIVRYKGGPQFDAAYFYCPYIPLQVAEIGEIIIQPTTQLRYRTNKNGFTTCLQL